MKKNLIVTIVLVLVMGVGCFYGGMYYQKSKTPSFGRMGNAMGRTGQNQQMPGGRMQTGERRQFLPVNGEISSMDGNTITVKGQDGSSKIVVYSTSTNINKAVKIEASDLKVGDEVMVMGTADASGTITAQTISVGGLMGQRPAEASPSSEK